jgi:hypothetical protein
MKIRHRNLIYLLLISMASVSHGIELSFAPIHDKFDYGFGNFVFGVFGFSAMSVLASLINIWLKKPANYWEMPNVDMRFFSSRSPLVIFVGLGSIFSVVSVSALIGYFIEVGSISSAYLFFLMGGVICFITAGINYLVFKSHYEKHNNQMQPKPNNASAD